MSFHKWLKRREYGLPAENGDRDFIMKTVYKSLDPYQYWNDMSDTPNKTSEYGAVFNLEFSPEGNVLVAACEKKAILLFDAITTKQTHQIMAAHTDNVNCIKFLDDRTFATCSDDTTVALWDLRYLKMKIRSLHGHSNWVKNIEYSQKDKLLVTSGFDGSIFTWDINSHTEQGLIYQKVFHTSGLMRCRIAPDGSKLVICTTGGYLMIIHNLDLTTLHKDLCGFRPSIYRLMQMGQQYIPQAAKFDHVFSKKQTKNRVELVTDFPDDNDAEVVLALQIHPDGHSFLSRNISFDEQTEWSCVHDINEEPGDITEQAKEPSGNFALRKRKLNCDSDEEPQRRETGGVGEEESGDSTDDVLYSVNRRARNQRLRLPGRGAPPPPPPTSGGSSSSTVPVIHRPLAPTQARADAFVPDIWAAEVTVQERAIRQTRARSSNSVTGYNFVYAISSGVLPAAVAAATASGNTASSTTLALRIRQSDAAAAARAARSSTASANTTRRAPTEIVFTRAAATPPTCSNQDRRVRRTVGVASPTLNASSTTDASSSTSSSDSPPPNTPFERIRARRSIVSLPLRNASSSSNSSGHNRDRQKIFQNPKKLMYYIQESNKGKGFIKEPCFSSDGRIICSPYDSGVRLLGFSDDCIEYPGHNVHAQRQPPRHLVEVKAIAEHADIVLSTKFSPREPLLVTGCRSGKVVWYHPNL